MTRILYHQPTATLRPYPRDDDGPIIGLDPELLDLELIQEPQPPHDPATHTLAPTETIDLPGGRVTRGWSVAPLPPPAPPSPDWTGFLSQLLLSPTLAGAQLQAQQMIADELQTATGQRQAELLRAWNALNGLPAVLAAAAPTGGPGLFVDAWLALRQAQLVSPQVAGALTELAQAYHLPADLIDALGAEP